MILDCPACARANLPCKKRVVHGVCFTSFISQSFLLDVAYDFVRMLTRAALTDLELARGRTGFGGWCHVGSVSAMVEARRVCQEGSWHCLALRRHTGFRRATFPPGANE